MVDYKKNLIEEGYRLLQLDSDEVINRLKKMEKLAEDAEDAEQLNSALEWNDTVNITNQEEGYAKLESNS